MKEDIEKLYIFLIKKYGGFLIKNYKPELIRKEVERVYKDYLSKKIKRKDSSSLYKFLISRLEYIGYFDMREELCIVNNNLYKNYENGEVGVVVCDRYITHEKRLKDENIGFDNLIGVLDKYFIRTGGDSVCECVAYHYRELSMEYPLMTFIACCNIVMRWLDDSFFGNGNRPIEVWDHALNLKCNEYRLFKKECYTLECAVWKALEFSIPGPKYGINSEEWKEEISFFESV